MVFTYSVGNHILLLHAIHPIEKLLPKNVFRNTEITNMGKMQKLHNHTRPIKYYMCIIGFCGVTNENQYISQNVFPLSYMIQLFSYNILNRNFDFVLILYEITQSTCVILEIS